MAQSDPIQEFIDLPRDQQMQTLQQLSPEKQNNLLAQVKQRKSKTTTSATPATLKQRANAFMAPRPIDPNVPNLSLPGMPEISGKVLAQVPNTARGVLRGAASLVRHPIDTLVGGAGTPFVAAGTTPEGYPAYSYTGTGADAANVEAQKSAQQDVAGQIQQAKEQPGYTLGEFLGQAAVTHAITKVPGLAELPKRAAQAVRETAQESLGAGREYVEKKAEGYDRRATRVEDKNKAIAQKNADQSATVQKKNAKQLKDEAKARIDTLKENREATRKHEQARQGVREHNEGVMREERNRATTQQKHDAATKELDTRIETERVKAKGADDSAWGTWRKKVKGKEAPSDNIVQKIQNQRSTMDPEDVAEFRKVMQESKPTPEDMGEVEVERNDISQGQFKKPFEKLNEREKALVNRVLEDMGLDPDDVEEATKPVNADRLHVWKTQLEQAARRATRGNVRYAIGQVLDEVRSTEDALSEQAGAGQELDSARKLHREYSEAFTDSPSERATNASKTLQENAPDYVKEQARAERLQRLGKYDPEIPKLAEHIGNLRQGLESLPEGPLRERFQQPPARPEATPKPKPGEVAPPPRATEAIPEPAAPDLTAARRKVIANKLRRYGAWGSWVLRLLVGGGTAAIFKGEAPTHLAVDLGVGQVGVTVLMRALERDSVLDWLAKPSADDVRIINELPPERAAKMRAALTGLAREEVRQNPSLATTKIAPALVGFMGSPTIQPLPANRKEALARIPAAPGTHVFHVREWASHPENRGKDEKQAIAEAQRQGYTVVQ